MSGAFAGGVSVILFQGIDVVKSRMQVRSFYHFVSLADFVSLYIYSENNLINHAFF